MVREKKPVVNKLTQASQLDYPVPVGNGWNTHPKSGARVDFNLSKNSLGSGRVWARIEIQSSLRRRAFKHRVPLRKLSFGVVCYHFCELKRKLFCANPNRIIIRIVHLPIWIPWTGNLGINTKSVRDIVIQPKGGTLLLLGTFANKANCLRESATKSIGYDGFVDSLIISHDLLLIWANSE